MINLLLYNNNQILLQNTITALLYRDGFRQVSRLIAIMSSQDGQMVTQQLQRDDVDHRLQTVLNFWDAQNDRVWGRFLHLCVVL
jgi:hypothetical protein